MIKCSRKLDWDQIVKNFEGKFGGCRFRRNNGSFVPSTGEKLKSLCMLQKCHFDQNLKDAQISNETGYKEYRFYLLELVQDINSEHVDGEQAHTQK